MNIHFFRITILVLLSYLATACTLIPPWRLCHETPNAPEVSGYSEIPRYLSYPSSPSLEVTEVAWTNGIGEDKNPLRKYYYIAPPSQPLFLWTKIKGERSAIEALQRNGQLFIWHVWYHDHRLVNKVPLEIGGPELLHTLSSSTQINGSFSWRTWSRKVFKPKEDPRGLWQVKLFYSNMTPLQCGQQACEYKIWVR